MLFVTPARITSVAPREGAWIEIQLVPADMVRVILSLPARERGLKYLFCPEHKRRAVSLPARERGLKLYRTGPEHSGETVAPREGAWIEIYLC